MSLRSGRKRATKGPRTSCRTSGGGWTNVREVVYDPGGHAIRAHLSVDHLAACDPAENEEGLHAAVVRQLNVRFQVVTHHDRAGEIDPQASILLPQTEDLLEHLSGLAYVDWCRHHVLAVTDRISHRPIADSADLAVLEARDGEVSRGPAGNTAEVTRAGDDWKLTPGLTACLHKELLIPADKVLCHRNCRGRQAMIPTDDNGIHIGCLLHDALYGVRLRWL
mmetsp:Transcript_113219/g.283469  ORF Transcript_113219/g.283469 Transcript_113219/m.283469 type:complete len:222 (-) Transcript_113219:2079-2744(-)